MSIKLSDVCDVRDGTHDSPSYVDKGFPLVTSKNIINGKIDLSVVNYLSKEDYDKINQRSKVDIPLSERNFIISDFKDEILSTEVHGSDLANDDLIEYKNRVNSYIVNHKDEAVIAKLHTNQPL